MKNILVPIGSHSNALNTLQYAINFAESVQARIYFIHIFSSSKIAGNFINIDSILVRDSKKMLKEYMGSIDSKGVEIIPKSLKGHSVIDSIKQLNEALDIDLIITATKALTIDNRVFLGNVTGSMVKDIKKPILIVPSEAKFKPLSKILMTIKSGTIKSKSTIKPLIKIQESFNSEINLLQVKTPQLEEKDLVINKNLIKHISELILTENATVFQGVLEFLHDQNPDLICVIRRKRGFFKKLWEENRVMRVNFDSKIPLLVLKGDQ